MRLRRVHIRCIPSPQLKIYILFWLWMQILGLVESEENVLSTCSFVNCRCTFATGLLDRGGFLRCPRCCIFAIAIGQSQSEGWAGIVVVSKRMRGSTRRRAATLEEERKRGPVSQCRPPPTTTTTSHCLATQSTQKDFVAVENCCAQGGKGTNFPMPIPARLRPPENFSRAFHSLPCPLCVDTRS
jgi:hypothetical protein